MLFSRNDFSTIFQDLLPITIFSEMNPIYNFKKTKNKSLRQEVDLDDIWALLAVKYSLRIYLKRISDYLPTIPHTM